MTATRGDIIPDARSRGACCPWTLPALPVLRSQPPLIFDPAPNVIDYAGDDDEDKPGRPRDQPDIVECHC
jgi:hypothetical protein